MSNWNYVASTNTDGKNGDFVGIFHRNWCIEILTSRDEGQFWSSVKIPKSYYAAGFHSALLEKTGIGRITVVYSFDSSSPTKYGYYDDHTTDGWELGLGLTSLK